MPLIAFSGLPGIGKTTIARLVASQLKCKAFLEPEEEEWPITVQYRYPGTEEITFFWFRSIRGNNLFLADQESRKQAWAVVDTMYEHIRKAYVAHYGISRLAQHHKFEDVIEAVCTRDWECLAKPDFCFFLHTDQQSWLQRLRARQRISDQVLQMEDHFSMQEIMEKATSQYCSEKGIFFRSLRNDANSQDLVLQRVLTLL